MDNPVSLVTLGSHDTGQRLEKTEGEIKNGQSSDIGNIGHKLVDKQNNKKHNTKN